MSDTPDDAKARCYAHRSRYAGVRRVRGRSWQARVQVSGGRKWEFVNLGLFVAARYGGDLGAAEAAAGRAYEEYTRRAYDQAAGRQRDPWEVVRELQGLVRFGRPLVPPDVLPRWVYARPDGAFGARCRRPRHGIAFDLGPFLTPEAAHAAARGWVGRLDPYLNPYLPPPGGVLTSVVIRPSSPGGAVGADDLPG